jgi:hypothetical protein
MLKIFEYLAIGSALAFAICLVALMFFYGSPSATSQPPQQQHAEENKAVKNQSEADKPFWGKATTDPVAAFTLFLVIFTAILSAVGVIQLKMLTRAETVAEKTAQAAKDSADIAKQALIAGQRAFISVNFRPSAQKSIKDGNIYAYGFTPVWFNAGNTPTRKMENHINIHVFDKEIAGDWDFPNLWSAKVPAEKRGPIPLGVSPKNIVDGQSLAIDVKTIQDVIDGKKFLYFWGSATYNDVFPDTPRYVTRFAVQIVAGGNPQEPEHMSFSFPLLGKYNCSDEECKYQGVPADWKPRIMETE